MKRVIAMVLALIAVLSLAACGQPAEPAPTEPAQTQPATEAPTETPTEAPTEEPTEAPTEAPTEPEPQPYMDALEARYHADTDGGYHIREIKDDQGKRVKVCIDSQGFITYTVDPEEEVLTGVYEGVFITTTDSQVRIRSAADGSVVFEENIDENTVAYPMEAPFRDGYALYMVHKKESYNGVSYELGFVDVTGQWVMEMTSEAALFDYITDGGSLNYFGSYYNGNMHYCGADLLRFESQSQGSMFFDIKNNQVISIQEAEYNPPDDMAFINGKTEPYNAWTFELGVLYTDGSVKKVPDERVRVSWEGAFDETYFDAETDTVYYLRAEHGSEFAEHRLFVCDNTGKVYKEHFGTYSSISDGCGFLDNGTAPIILHNQEDTTYYTVVGIDGEFLFEPIKVTSVFVVDAATGYVIQNGYSSEEKTALIVVDSQGNVIYAVDRQNMDTSTPSVCNGILHYSNAAENYYIDITQ